MKPFLFLLTILATTFSYSQDAIHFLFTTEGNYKITEPLCTGMIEEAENLMKLQLAKIKEFEKSRDFNVKQGNLVDKASLAVLEKLAKNPTEYFAVFYPIVFIFDSYNEIFLRNLYPSLQEVSTKGLIAPSIQIHIRNVVINPSQTSLEMDIIDLQNSNAPKKTNRFICPTGRLLQDQAAQTQWYDFWEQFFDATEMSDWLSEELYKINNKLITEKQINQALDAKLSELGMNTTTYVQERVAILKDKLTGFSTNQINFEETQGILMSKDQNNFLVYTLSEELPILWESPNYEFDQDTVKQFELTTWLYKFNPNGEIHYGINENDYITQDQTKTQLNKFYSAAFTPAPEFNYNETQWVASFFDEGGPYTYTNILKYESQSKESSDLIQTYIKPYLKELTALDSCQYTNYYQRTSPNINYDIYIEEEIPATIFQDYLISNPEKTAFIFPVLLQNRSAQDRDYYYTNEDFKFYVLLKNELGTYDLYDWHYFSTLPYKNYYSLLNCAHSHLMKISNWDGESDFINDPAFWNDFIAKKSDRGFDYLTMFTAKDQSPIVSKSEFEAQVQDCYKLLSEHDVANLYPNQLKQVILCLNTIHTFNLKGKDEMQLATLATQLHFEKRLNKVQKSAGYYYPMLHLEFGGNLQPHSYYQLK